MNGRFPAPATGKNEADHEADTRRARWPNNQRSTTSTSRPRKRSRRSSTRSRATPWSPRSPERQRPTSASRPPSTSRPAWVATTMPSAWRPRSSRRSWATRARPPATTSAALRAALSRPGLLAGDAHGYLTGYQEREGANEGDPGCDAEVRFDPEKQQLPGVRHRRRQEVRRRPGRLPRCPRRLLRLLLAVPPAAGLYHRPRVCPPEQNHHDGADQSPDPQVPSDRTPEGKWCCPADRSRVRPPGRDRCRPGPP